VSHVFLSPNPRRRSKIKNVEFPETKREMRSFWVLSTSIRRVTPTDTVREMSILAPLASSKKNVHFKPEAKHLEAFEKIKVMLLTESLFCHPIDEKTNKYMF
jgi:hypothetical protein